LEVEGAVAEGCVVEGARHGCELDATCRWALVLHGGADLIIFFDETSEMETK